MDQHDVTESLRASIWQGMTRSGAAWTGTIPSKGSKVKFMPLPKRQAVKLYHKVRFSACAALTAVTTR